MTSSPTPNPTPTILVQPTATLTATESTHIASSLAINSFTVDVEVLPPTGKRLTFTWNITAATKATIAVNNADRFFPLVPVDPISGTTTLELWGTKYSNPAASLLVWDGGSILWPCHQQG